MFWANNSNSLSCLSEEKGKEGVSKQKIAMSFIHSIENKVGIQITIAPYRTTPIEKKMKIDTARTQKYTVVRNSFQVMDHGVLEDKYDNLMTA